MKRVYNMSSSCWFISDVHLTEPSKENWKIFSQFLNNLSLKTSPGKIIFLGDIFDLWIGPSFFFHSKYQEIVDKILILKEKGWEIIYLEGNHDFHIRKFWKQYQIPVFDKAYSFRFENKLIRVEHGDLINLEDLAYLRYYRVVRSLPFKLLVHLLSGKKINEIGIKLSKHSRGKSSQLRINNEEQFRKMVRNHAMKAYKESSPENLFDVIVTGHMHFQDDWFFDKSLELSVGKEVEQNKVHSFNLGSWYEKPLALELFENQFNWHYFKS